MEVILLERIAKLGQMGQVVKVKAGYARNYLLPRKKALRATDTNKTRFEELKLDLEARDLERRADAEVVATKLNGQECVLLRQAAETGQLYGSVTARDVADAVIALGFKIERGQVDLNTPIKTLGMHKVNVALHAEVIAEVTVNVARSMEEAERQTSGAASDAVAAAEAFFESEELAEKAVDELSDEHEDSGADEAAAGKKDAE